jgi:FkbM family methyltransferase
MQKVLEVLVGVFAGRGIDKKFPFFVVLFKKFASLGEETTNLVRIPLNSSLFVSGKDTALGFSLRFKGNFEPVQTRKFIKSVKKGDTVLDVGANVGYYTVLASKLVGAKGKVYAFEPDRRNVELLNKNIKLNNCLNVEVVPLALGAKNKISYFLSDKTNPGESRISEKVTRELVRVKTLDTLVRERKIKKVDVIKLDVEGGEVDVLRGAKTLLTTSRNLKLFTECNPKALNDLGADETTLTAFLKGS